MNEEIDYRIKTLVGLGRALTVLLVVMWLNKPCSELEVAEYTGYNRKTCRKYLHDLNKMKYLTRTWERGGWLITGYGRQMVLGENLSPDLVKGKNEEVKGKFYPLPFTTTTTIGSEPEDEEAEVVVNKVKGKNDIFKGNFYPFDSALFIALTRAGIVGRVREGLSQREDLDAEIVGAFEAELKRRKGDHYSTGLLVHVLREYQEGDPIPEDPDDESIQRRKYVDGKYAEFINR